MRASILLVLAATLSPALAAEQQIALKPAPGLDRVEANCGACHSLDYIP